MTKRERVIAAIEGREPDGVPSSFSLHFPADKKTGEAGVKAHLDFFKAADMDIIKVMNEYRLPIPEIIRTPQDYDRTIPENYKDQQFLKDQLAFAKEIVAKADPDAFSMGTLHGAAPSSYLPFMNMGKGYTVPEANHLLGTFLRWDEKTMLRAMQRIADGLCELAAGYIKEAKMDAVYYAAPGGSRQWLTDEEHARWIKPFDLQIMKAVKDAGGYCVLHICQSDVSMDRYATGYAEYADVVNWGVYDVPFSLEDGRELFGKTILGGLANHSGVMVDGTEEDVRKEVRNIIGRFGRKNFILGADCTLPTTQDMKLLNAAIDEARHL